MTWSARSQALGLRSLPARTRSLLLFLEASRFRIQPLTRQERGDYVRTRLGDGAQPLIEQLRADRVLDDLTRTPMILAEVISLFQAGKKIPTSRLGVLDAVTQMMENSETHQAALANAPLSGLGRAFLERLGSSLVTRGSVQLPEATARQEINACSRLLQDAGQLGALPDPGSVLTALCSHHVLERSTYPDITYTFLAPAVPGVVRSASPETRTLRDRDERNRARRRSRLDMSTSLLGLSRLKCWRSSSGGIPKTNRFPMR